MGSLNYENKTSVFPDHSNISKLNKLDEIGPEVKGLLVNDPYIQKFFSPHHGLKSSRHIDLKDTHKNISWGMTASSHIISAEQSDRDRLSHHLYSLGKQFSLANGETCPLYKWVIFENPVQQKKSIGQVIEIL